MSLGPIKASGIVGSVTEQAFAVNVKDKGLIIIVPCGHTPITETIEFAEHELQLPIYAVIGGFHFPGNETASHENMHYADPDIVNSTIDSFMEKRIQVIGLSSHAISKQTINFFKDAWGKNYVDLAVGKTIIFGN